MGNVTPLSYQGKGNHCCNYHRKFESEISLSGEPLVLYSVCREDQAYSGDQEGEDSLFYFSGEGCGVGLDTYVH